MATSYKDKLRPVSTSTPASGSSSYQSKLRPVNQSSQTPSQPQDGILRRTFSGKPTFPAQEGGADTIAPNIARTFGNIPSSAYNMGRAVLSPINPADINSPLNIGANIAKGGSALKEIYGNAGIVGGTKSVLGGVADTAKKGFALFRGLGEKAYSKLEQDQEKAGSLTEGLGYTATDLLTEAAKIGVNDPLLIPSIVYSPSKVRGSGVTRDPIKRTSGPLVRASGDAVRVSDDVIRQATTRSERTIENAMVRNYEKGVRPLLPSRSTPSQVRNYRSNIVQGVKIIDQNKQNLSFLDETGELVTGRNPQSLQEFSEAIEQTKRNLFSQYNNLAKQAGKSGAIVRTADIANELDTVINNPALRITNPKAIQYADELKERLIASGQVDAVTAQEIIQNYNKSLEAFYRNPTYDTASQAAVDAMVANQMRTKLDDAINSLTGSEYQALRSQYSALKTLERDVIKAALRDARRSAKGLIDFTDIFSGGQIISGLLSFNPASIASGATQKAIATYFKLLNDPNRAIQRLFNDVEKLNAR